MIDDLLKQYPIVTDQINAPELRVLLRELERVLDAGVPGDIVEFGCYEGTAALFMQRVLQLRGEQRQLHVYDSFEGLPDKTMPDRSPAGEQFQAGELRASKDTLIKNFRQANLPLPIIHKNWFKYLTQEDMPTSVALAFLDGDFYESILDSLRLVWPRLSSGAAVLIDDFQSESLPGVAKALDEWARTHRLSSHPEASLAIVTANA